MAKRTISQARPATVRSSEGASRKAASDPCQDAFRTFLWEITSINVHLDQERESSAVMRLAGTWRCRSIYSNMFS